MKIRYVSSFNLKHTFNFYIFTVAARATRSPLPLLRSSRHHRNNGTAYYTTDFKEKITYFEKFPTKFCREFLL